MSFRIAYAWLALVVLLGMTMLLSHYLTGPLGFATSMTIALSKAAVIAWIFMHLDRQPPLARLMAFAATFWFLVMMSLTGLDYLSR